MSGPVGLVETLARVLAAQQRTYRDGRWHIGYDMSRCQYRAVAAYYHPCSAGRQAVTDALQLAAQYIGCTVDSLRPTRKTRARPTPGG